MNNSQKTINRLMDVFGSPSGMAVECGVRPQDVNNWLRRGFPKSSLLKIEQKSAEKGGDITVYELLAYVPPGDEKVDSAA